MVMTDIKNIKIGTRGSKLALWQAEKVQSLLRKKWPEIDISIHIFKTSGDWQKEQGEVRLNHEQGGKALFAKELEEALLAGDIDVAVHSLKDMDSVLPYGLEIGCVLPRDNANDALLLRNRRDLEEEYVWSVLSTVGTSSLRRGAFLQSINPGIKIIPLRGNVDTRLSKLRGDLAHEFPDLDGIILSACGLERLGSAQEIDHMVCSDVMLPAAGQGVIAIEILSNNVQLSSVLNSINCLKTQCSIVAERSVLQILGASCHTPIGVYAEFRTSDLLLLRATLLSVDGQQRFDVKREAKISNTEEAGYLGQELGRQLLDQAPSELLEQIVT